MMALATSASASPYSATGWGENRYGQLGDETTTTSDVPMAVSGLSGVVSVSGGGNHGMALMSNGTVMGWGANLFGQLCNGTHARTDVPVPVGSVDEVAAVSSGAYHSAILLDNGTVLTCGENNFGQLGDGNVGHGSGSASPVPVTGLSDVTAISAKGDDTLALLGNGTVVGWGRNESGQLGTGGTAGSDVPVPVSGLEHVSAIAAGHKYALALLEDGTVMAWGNNNRGQLGDGNTTDSYVPVQATGLSDVTSVSAGLDASIALLGDGTVMTWGNNDHGQLGTGGTASSDVPRPVSSLAGATAVSAGSGFDLALLSSGQVMSWGWNTFGQLGDGTTTNSNVPVTVSGLSDAADVAAADGKDSYAIGPPSPTIPAPTITDMYPKEGSVSGGTSVTITGANLSETTAVTFGSTAASFSVDSATSITVISPPEPAAIVDVRVTTPDAVTVITSTDRFRFRPTISKLEPNSGPKSGGKSVTVTGAGFATGKNATRFEFGSTKAGSVNCVSTTRCTVVTPAHAAGKVEVQATVNNLTSPRAPADKFTYN